MWKCRRVAVSVAWRTAAAYPARRAGLAKQAVDQPCGCAPTILRLAEYDPGRRSVPRSWCGRIDPVARVVHVPYVVEQDEDGVWCASAQLRPGVGAVGDGATAEAAVADLRDALEALLAEVGPPDELTLTLDVA